MNDKQRWEFYIAGVQHHEAYKVLKEMKEGGYLDLEPEPTNKFDSSAVKINFCQNHPDGPEGTMLGYVPGKISSMVTAALTISDHMTCKITEFSPNEKPWKQIKVVIEEENLQDENPDENLSGWSEPEHPVMKQS